MGKTRLSVNSKEELQDKVNNYTMMDYKVKTLTGDMAIVKKPIWTTGLIICLLFLFPIGLIWLIIRYASQDEVIINLKTKV